MKENLNRSGWRAEGQAVLLLAVELKERANQILLPKEVEMASSTADTEGVVVDIGPDCWNGTVGDAPNAKPETRRAEIGDRVLFTKFSGGIINGKDGRVYRMINCHAIYAREQK